jgi:hypothetical protein
MAKRAFDCFSFTFSIKEILLSIVFVLGSEMMEHLNKDSNSCLTSALLITAVITTAVLSPFLITSNIATLAAETTTVSLTTVVRTARL